MTRKDLFSPELRTASVVPRWSIVWTLTRDVLSNHSFFVAIYADQIADLIEWDGPRGDLLFMALAHDLDETITGDIVAPAKREILDTKRAEHYVAHNMEKRLPYIVERLRVFESRQKEWHDQAKAIVKVADRLDALLFLTTEARLGNGVILPRIPECEKSLKEAWDKLPYYTNGLSYLYKDVIEPAVEAHRTTGGYGI